jgi:hypothetical protein
MLEVLKTSGVNDVLNGGESRRCRDGEEEHGVAPLPKLPKRQFKTVPQHPA